MNDYEKLNCIDEVLASFEDWMHGSDGENCTKARKLLREVQQQVKNLNKCDICGSDDIK